MYSVFAPALDYKSMKIDYLVMVEAAGVEPRVSIDSTYLIDSLIGRKSQNAMISGSVVQTLYKNRKNLKDCQHCDSGMLMRHTLHHDFSATLGSLAIVDLFFKVAASCHQLGER